MRKLVERLVELANYTRKTAVISSIGGALGRLKGGCHKTNTVN